MTLKRKIVAANTSAWITDVLLQRPYHMSPRVAHQIEASKRSFHDVRIQVLDVIRNEVWRIHGFPI